MKIKNEFKSTIDLLERIKQEAAMDPQTEEIIPATNTLKKLF